ncbi:MAG: PKD domain-containing protein [bacterium]|nr:PKD domain-containing protein [bacterium]
MVDTIAYVADGDSGVQLINISETAPPAIISAVATPGYAQGVKLADALCYVADGAGGLVIVDVSDPDNPDIIGGTLGKALSGAMKVDVRGNYAFVTDEAAGLTVLDISNPAFPAELGNTATEDATKDLFLAGIFAFVADSGKGVKIINVADPNSPTIVGNAQVPATSLGVFVDGEFAYIAAGTGGLQICPTQCGYDESILADFEVPAVEGFYPFTTQFNNASVGYGMSYLWDFADGTTSTEESPAHTFAQPGAYNVVLTATNGTNTGTKAMEISALTEPAVLTGVSDIPDDQGRLVYISFFRSGFDSDGLGKGLEMYTIERLDGADWVAVATTGAYRRSYYKVVAGTRGDGAGWSTQFRVIAHMDEGNWASAPLAGFSLDNIAPATPANVAWFGAGRLGWDHVPDNDFAYYKVYGASAGDFALAVSLGTTIQNQYTIAEPVHAWHFVTAVDDAGLESEPAAADAITGVPGAPTAVELYPAAPNPFNPATNIAFYLPAAGAARLTVYDLRGRQVRALVDDDLPAGRHSAAWRGTDDAGQRVATEPTFPASRRAARL